MSNFLLKESQKKTNFNKNRTWNVSMQDNHIGKHRMSTALNVKYLAECPSISCWRQSLPRHIQNLNVECACLAERYSKFDFFRALKILYVFSFLSNLDVDECKNSLHNCDRNADCTNNIGGFDCQCRAGFTGNGTKGNCTGK